MGTMGYDGICNSRGELEALPAGHWCEIANSHLEAAEKLPEDYDDFDGSHSSKYASFQRNMGINAVTRTWNSATMDTKRNRLLVTGGGHNDYGGNEVYAFELETLSWTRLTDPTPFPGRSPDYRNADGTPVSRHTYGGLLYIESEDALFLFGGAPDAQAGGCGVRGAWLLDLTALDSEPYAPKHWSELPSDNEPATHCDIFAQYDSARDRVIFGGLEAWSTLDVQSRTWSLARNESRGPLRFTHMGIAPSLDLLVHVGGSSKGTFTAYRDLKDPSLSRQVVQASGDLEITEFARPGVSFDPISELVIAYKGGPDVFALDTTTNVWSRIGPSATNGFVPGPVTTEGVYGRFAYSAADDLFIYVDRVDRNVVAYRLDRSRVSAVRPQRPQLFVE
jgi:hypothetical protein